MKILLVDDDLFLRDMYATKFSETGHEVSAVDHGERALSQLESDDSFDVILVDMVMPGMNGTELVRQMKERNLAEHSLLIVLSNQGQQADIDEAKEAGVSEYIIKAEHIPSDVVRRVEEFYQAFQKESKS